MAATNASIETLANGAIAAGCLQAVMSMVHPELVKFVSFQKERVARRDAEQPAHNFRTSDQHRPLQSEPRAADGSVVPAQYLRQYWHSHLRFFGLNPELPGVVQRALMYRNKVSHQSHMTLAQYEAAIATFENLQTLLSATRPLDSNQGAGDQVTLIFASSTSIFMTETERGTAVAELKLIGNDYFKEGNYTEAIEAYSQGLVVAPNQAVLYGNRARCYLRLKKFSRAREDAENALEADNYENIKYYRLLSETLMGMKDFDEAKEICDQGLELARRICAAAKAIQEATSRKNKAKKKKNTLKNTAPEMELVAMINYQEVPAKWIEVHTRGSRRLEMYQQGMESLVVAAKALLQVTDSIGMPGRSRLPLDQLVKEGMANLRKAGEAGVAEAWFRLGVLYSSSVRKGMPLTADPHKCWSVGEAENELGVCYRDGRPASVVEADPKKAFHFFLSANVDVTRSTARTARSQQYLAQLFEKGYGGRRDETQAREWSLTASQNRLTDLLMKHDFADVGVTAFGGGKIADKFASNPTASQRGKEVFQQFYDAYLDEKGNGESAFDAVDSDGEEIQITKVSSYTPSASLPRITWVGVVLQTSSAVIDAEIQARARNGGITACKYLESEKLLGSASKLLAVGDIKGALRDLKKADLRWERPKGVFSTTSSADLLPKVLKEAAVSLQINPRDIDAAYVLGRWEMMSDQDIILHWKRCVKMHPNEASFHFYLGVAYLTLQRYNDAMDAMEAALAIEKKPDWLYWFAAPMIGLGMIDPALAVYKEYVDSNPPDERFIPDAYYSIGALYFKKYDNAMATVYHELGQMAEFVTIRFPAFYPRVLHDTPKETLRSGMKKNGYMESSVIANIMAQNMIECGFCKAQIKPTQLLGHKLSKCPRRTVSCQDCNEEMVFDSLQTHRQSRHASTSNGKKKKGKKKKKNNAQENERAGSVSTPILKPRGDQQELAAPKFHFAGAIVEVTKGKNNYTVFSLQTVINQRWTLRVDHSTPPSGSSAVFDAEVDNSVLVFWRRPPPLEMVDRRALAVPMEGDVYGQDLRHNKYMENGTLCAGCGNPPYFGEGLSACGACKAVKYAHAIVSECTGNAFTMQAKKDSPPPNISREEVVYVDDTEELHYFFQIPPHNPLKLKSDGSQVFLNNCKRLSTCEEMSLGTYSLLAIAELLDYLLSNTNLYLA
ncbi:Tetratricopeptide repeat [Phytophthora cactorum]|nr:Tetratricopeptide repeat [Phytophthora cactorum]